MVAQKAGAMVVCSAELLVLLSVVLRAVQMVDLKAGPLVGHWAVWKA